MSDADDILREIEELAAEGEQLRAEAEAAQQELLELLGRPETGTVTAAFDGRGLLAALTFDAAAASLDPESLLRDINIAISIAGEEAAGEFAPVFEPEILAGDDPQNDDLFASIVSDLGPETTAFADDFGYLRISAMWGTVMSVDAQERWLATTPHKTIGDEIVRIARIAALGTDRFGRFGDGGDGRGGRAV